MTNPCKHECFVDGYYGYHCANCNEFMWPYGSAPWDDEFFDDGDDDESEFDCGWVTGVGCQLAGSEICDFECPFRDDNYKGLRLTQSRLAKQKAARCSS